MGARSQTPFTEEFSARGRMRALWARASAQTAFIFPDIAFPSSHVIGEMFLGGNNEPSDTVIISALLLSLIACSQEEPRELPDRRKMRPPWRSGTPRTTRSSRAGRSCRARCRALAVRSSCAPSACTAQCNDDEIVIFGWCGARRNEATLPTERSASCRPVATNNPIIALCAKAPSP